MKWSGPHSWYSEGALLRQISAVKSITASQEEKTFVQRRNTIAGSTEVEYAENGTDAVGTYTIANPDRDFS